MTIPADSDVAPADPLGAKIMSAVADLMRQGGVGAVTSESVAARASVSKATIYRRWHSMGELVAAAATHSFPEVEVPDLGDTIEELRHFLTTRIEQYSAPGSSVLVSSLIGAAVSDSHVHDFFESWVHAQSVSTRAVFERAKARGEFEADLDIDDLRTIMSAPIMFRAVAEHRQPDAALVEAILTIIRSAMNEVPTNGTCD